MALAVYLVRFSPVTYLQHLCREVQFKTPLEVKRRYALITILVYRSYLDKLLQPENPYVVLTLRNLVGIFRWAPPPEVTLATRSLSCMGVSGWLFLLDQNPSSIKSVSDQPCAPYATVL